MRTKSFGVGIVFLVVLLGLGYWFSTSGTVDTSHQQDTQDTTENVENGQRVVVRTTLGDITIELFTEEMPITAGNFLTLAESGFYDGVKFHRVIPNFMAQAGDPLTKDNSQMHLWGTGGSEPIEDEFVEGLSNVRGTIAMANKGQPMTGSSQFFINVADNTGLDFDKSPLTSKHPVFGRVVEGMDVVDAIVSVPTEGPGRPVKAVVIDSIVIIE